MAILSITQISPTGQVGTPVAQYQMDTNDTLAKVTTAGYINSNRSVASIDLTSPGVMLANTTDEGVVLLNVEVGSGGVITLVNTQSTSDIVLPTTAGRLAQFKDASGTLGDATGNAVVEGNFQAGSSGVSGAVSSFPATANTGSLVLRGVSSSGDFTTTISNASMAANRTYSIPDAGANCLFLMASGDNSMNANGSIRLARDVGTIISGAVTINAQVGTITTGPLSITVPGSISFTLNNTFIQVNSLCNFFVVGGGTNTALGLTFSCAVPSVGSVVVTLYADGADNVSGSVKIGFVIY